MPRRTASGARGPPRTRQAAWFNGPEEWGPVEYELDFRVGGREVNSGGPPGGPSFTYEATYRDIVPGERFIYAYDMHSDDVADSVSLGTVELAPAGVGTRLTYTSRRDARWPDRSSSANAGRSSCRRPRPGARASAPPPDGSAPGCYPDAVLGWPVL